MAKIKLTGGFDKLSGKLGGSIFGYSSNGNYIKQNSFSQQPNSPKQSIQRNRIIQASQSWRLTSLAQKNLWENEVVNYPYINAVGDLSFYNGFQLFQFLNQNNFVNGFPILLSPPPFAAVVNANWSVLVNPANQLIMSTTNGANGTTAVVYCAPPQILGKVPRPTSFLKTLEITVTGGSQAAGLENAYEQVFGFQSGSKVVWAKIKTIVNNNGNTTNFSDPTNVLFDF